MPRAAIAIEDDPETGLSVKLTLYPEEWDDTSWAHVMGRMLESHLYNELKRIGFTLDEHFTVKTSDLKPLIAVPKPSIEIPKHVHTPKHLRKAH